MSGKKELNEALQELATEGITAAAKALIDVCNDETAPTAARVQAASQILRINGFFDDEEKDIKEKALSDATTDDLKAQLRELQQERSLLSAK